MQPDFASIHNFHERSVFEAVVSAAAGYPRFSGNAELLADVACVALNRLPPRYIRNDIDFAFYLSDQERADNARQVAQAVEFGFEFVQARSLMRARV